MDDVSAIVKTIIKAYPSIVPFLDTTTLKALGGYEGIRAAYWAAIYDSVYGYLLGNRPVTAFVNSASISMSESFTDAVYLGHEEAGGTIPLDDDTAQWLNQRIGAERGFIIELFARLKNDWQNIDPVAEAFARSDGFAKTLDAVYAEAKLRGMKNQMVTWHLGATEVNCATCKALSEKKHRISYLIEKNYIPRKPGASMDCGGYNCDCGITDKLGNEVIL